ncbi:MAG: hypothetical protein SF052_09190 [Bacteroidia bacterium]|nr:hypothetical protein [Bacteroidia bacterium]
MLRHTSSVRKFTYITGIAAIAIGVIGIIAVFGVLEYRKSHPTVQKPCAAFVSEDLVPAAFRVTVTRVSQDSVCSLSFETDAPVEGVSRFCFCPSPDLVHRFTIAPGDIFTKEAGAEMVTFLKPAGNQSATFLYPCCGGE